MSSDSLFVGSILFFVSLTGVFTNWTVLLFLPKVSSFNKSFGYITWNQAFGDALQSTTVFTLVVPMVFFDLEVLKANSNYISLSMLLGYDISVLSHLLLALNRLCVVASPLKFETYNEKYTRPMIISVNIYAFASVIIFLLSGCKYSWSTEMWMFLYHVSNQCVSFSFYAIFCKYISIIFIIVLIDVFVICKARFMYKKSKNDAKSKQMNSKEICFLVQTCLQGVLFSIELICYFIISPRVEDTWVRFFMTTFAFSTIHACDGAISIACNSDFRSYLRRCSMKKISNRTESALYASRVDTSTLGGFRSRTSTINASAR
ncbi:7TM GPCR serpentine receptor class x (Srx) domain-containing protein [Caenorhabditis elegans]|uniref:7TM GPCR serpentine receptor class x (Srx) domain-containing protein n=1 Tax=Caenorhabditis elegans TaxID=6239 RepID=Q19027_CAEEL|nr:7TM GPCR serpentine receptor class x (Srx) domain-containing protein [Caenorhabditis elegans]CCD68587.1 7TM GPCR serpentine receptor class x (Srx) domain-containing protein [Caenorhabditis elegans]|eukprot:NP_505423.1 Serpentine Receptor, class X [Caenorhabditis elegans]